MNQRRFASAILGLSLPFTLQAAPSVAVDIAPLHSLVSQVMDGVGEPDLLIPVEASPHHYTLRPSQASALANADVVFWVGEEYTPWLEKAIDNVADSAITIEALSIAGNTTHAFREGATFEPHDHSEHEEHVEKEHDEHEHHEEHNEKEHDEHEHHKEHNEKEHNEHEHHEEHDEEGHDKHEEHAEKEHDKHEHHEEHAEKEHDKHEHHEAHDRKEHDEHDHHGIDPHAWLDPVNAKVWVSKIQQTLSKQDPEHAQQYRDNAAKAHAELDKLIAKTQADINKLQGLKFIVFHDAYQYFEKRFNITAAGSISISDAQDPSPARVKEVSDTVKSLSVTCVFTEPQFNAGIVSNVFAGSKVTTAVMDPIGVSIPVGKTHYQLLIKEMVNSLQQCK